jgi:hypothetical protein
LETYDITDYFFGKLRSLFLENETLYLTDDAYLYSWENGNLEELTHVYNDEDYFSDFHYVYGFPLIWTAWRDENELEFEFFTGDINWDFEYVSSSELQLTDEVNYSKLQDMYMTFNSSQEGLLLLHTNENGEQGLFISYGNINNITPAIENKVPESSALAVYPNPFYKNGTRDQINFTWSLPQSETGKLTIFNLKGQILKQWEITGRGENSFNLSELNNGLYLIKLSSKSTEIYQKFILLK